MRELTNFILSAAVAVNAAPIFSEQQTPEPPIVPQFLIRQVGSNHRIALNRPTVDAYDGLLKKGKAPPMITSDMLASAAADFRLIPKSGSAIDVCSESIASNNPLLFTAVLPETHTSKIPKRAIKITPVNPGLAEFIIDLPPECMGKEIRKTAPAINLPAATTTKTAKTERVITSSHGSPQDTHAPTGQNWYEEFRTTALCVTGSLATLFIILIVKFMSMRINSTAELKPTSRAKKSEQKRSEQSYDDNGSEYWDDGSDDARGSLTAGKLQSAQTVLPPQRAQLPVIIEGSTVNVLPSSAQTASRGQARLAITSPHLDIDTKALHEQGFRITGHGEIDVIPTQESKNALDHMLRQIGKYDPDLLEAIRDGEVQADHQIVYEPIEGPQDESAYRVKTPTEILSESVTSYREIEHDEDLTDEFDPSEDNGDWSGKVHGEKESEIQLKDVGSGSLGKPSTFEPQYMRKGDEDPNLGSLTHLHPDDDPDEAPETELPARQMRSNEDEGIEG